MADGDDWNKRIIQALNNAASEASHSLSPERRAQAGEVRACIRQLCDEQYAAASKVEELKKRLAEYCQRAQAHRLELHGARAEERVAIVSWLRALGGPEGRATGLALMIEREDHLLWNRARQAETKVAVEGAQAALARGSVEEALHVLEVWRDGRTADPQPETAGNAQNQSDRTGEVAKNTALVNQREGAIAERIRIADWLRARWAIALSGSEQGELVERVIKSIEDGHHDTDFSMQETDK